MCEDEQAKERITTYQKSLSLEMRWQAHDCKDCQTKELQRLLVRCWNEMGGKDWL